MKIAAFVFALVFSSACFAQDKPAAPPAAPTATPLPATPPAAAPAPVPTAAAAPAPAPVAAKPVAPKPMTASRKARRQEDARHCLEKSSNDEIIKCAEEYL